MRKLLKGRALLAVLIVAVIAAGGVGYAAVADDGGTVYACKKKNGQVTFADGPGECKRNEEEVALAGAGGVAVGGGNPAYAHVENSTLDVARSKGVVAMSTSPSSFSSIYCFDLAFVPVNALASVDLLDYELVNIWTAVAGTAGMAQTGCPAATDAAVVTVGGAQSFYAAWN